MTSQGFGIGMIISLEPLVSTDWSPVPDHTNISIVPELFFDGTVAIATNPDCGSILNIIPALSEWAVLVASTLLPVSHRRRRLACTQFLNGDNQ